MSQLTLSPPIVGRGKGGAISSFNCIQWNKHIEKQSGPYLPHWDQENTLNFVTFRLADSLPQSKLKILNEARTEWIKKHPKPWTPETAREYNNLFHDTDKWLDQGLGSCILKYAEVQQIVNNAINNLDGIEYDLYEYVIMPNHIHMIIAPANIGSNETMGRIKSYTARQINNLLNTHGKVWQRDIWDRLIRSVTDYEETADYIRHNPDPIAHLYK